MMCFDRCNCFPLARVGFSELTGLDFCCFVQSPLDVEVWLFGNWSEAEISLSLLEVNSYGKESRI